jgi:hypothetical protein
VLLESLNCNIGTLHKLILKCCAENPTKRYSSVSTVIIELEKWAANFPMDVEEANVILNVSKFFKRNVLSSLISFSLVVTIIFVTLSALYERNLKNIAIRENEIVEEVFESLFHNANPDNGATSLDRILKKAAVQVQENKKLSFSKKTN